jgi:Fe-S cluster assembly iron-binding protein IscA|tara:strand:+ start:274 stop:651 length:378 start_codon:yes stop_codon:yes gene_type:complete
MSDPNIARLGNLQAKNVPFRCTNTDPLLLLSTTSAQTIKINSLYVTNTNECSKHTAIRVYINDGLTTEDTSNYHLAKDIVVPLRTTLILIDRESVVYLRPNQYLWLVDELGNAIEGVINYDIMRE